MIDHKIAPRAEWLAARLQLLESEKALTRRGDELARMRQELPWVRVDKEYRFETGDGAATLAYLFRGRSSFGTDFNYDYQVARTEEQQRSGNVEYNFRPMDMRPALQAPPESWVAQIAESTGTDVATYMREGPGLSAFVLKDGVVYHTYSAYGRGVDAVWGMYQWLERAPLGRNEDSDRWLRRPHEYQRT